MGTYVTNDPASLRYAAAQLRHRADVFLDVAAQVESTVSGAVVVGPMGERMRAGISATSGQLRGTCDRIVEVAQRLLREADRAEAELASAQRPGLYY